MAECCVLGARSKFTRRKVLSAAAGGGCLLALSITGAQAKLAQTAVAYQQTPNGDKQCDSCNFFVAPNACKEVAGDIVPTGYCKLWNKKQS
jgi:hypothetical protein